MEVRELYSITEARKLLGGISRNTIYALLNTGQVPSVIVQHRRFIAAAAISKFIELSTSSVAPSTGPVRDRHPSASSGQPTPIVPPTHKRSTR
jgi:predicted DNA-binding transcriptional regulator AlpA